MQRPFLRLGTVIGWLMLAVLCAVVYGIVNDQITVTLAPEYFSVFKRAQFGPALELAGLVTAPTRVQAILVGTLASTPESVAPIDAIAAALAKAGAMLQERREYAGQRQAVIASNAEPVFVEGESPLGHLSMVEFPSIEDAQAWYDSPEYAEARALTPAAFRGPMLMFVEGIKSP